MESGKHHQSEAADEPARRMSRNEILRKRSLESPKFSPDFPQEPQPIGI
jgi:hypothetical protein